MPDETVARKRDVIDELCDLIRESDLRIVFWMCPVEGHRGVTWTHGDGKSVATCTVCGRNNTDEPATHPAQPEA